MAASVQRGAKRTKRPDLFLSHSSKDKADALRLAKTLNYCAVDVWLDDWEMEVGQSLPDEISKAMNESRYIAVLITENYNNTVWTKKEYKKAVARGEKEERNVLLPLIVGEAEVPEFLEEKIYLDLRQDYFSGILKIVGLVHAISSHRISSVLAKLRPTRVGEVWHALMEIGFEPFVVLGKDDFDELVKLGGVQVKDDYAYFDPYQIIHNTGITRHLKSIVQGIDL